MKKLFAILLAVVLMATMSVTAFAEEPDGNLSITRDGVTTYYEYIVEAFENAVDGDVIKVEQDYIEEYCNVAYSNGNYQVIFRLIDLQHYTYLNVQIFYDYPNMQGRCL